MFELPLCGDVRIEVPFFQKSSGHVNSVSYVDLFLKVSVKLHAFKSMTIFSSSSHRSVPFAPKVIASSCSPKCLACLTRLRPFTALKDLQ